MVQATEARHGGHVCGRGRLRLDSPSVRCALFERVVNMVLMVVAHVFTHEPESMSFVQRDDMLQDLSATTSNPRSAVPFCQGDWMLVRFGFSPAAFRNAITVALNFESRSRIT